MISTFVQRAASCSLFFIVSFFTLLLSEPSRAADFSVSPVRVELSDEHNVQALRVQNNGKETASIQLELLEWRHPEGTDKHTPTSELLATPPIFTVPPGESQIVRVGLRRAPHQSHELSYRLLLEEIPPPLQDNYQGLRVALRLSIPVFVQPSRGTPYAELQWSAEPGDDGIVLLTAVNVGRRHGKVSDLRVNFPDGRVLHPKNGSPYVLPGARRTWQVRSITNYTVETTLELSAQVNGRNITSRMPVE